MQTVGFLVDSQNATYILIPGGSYLYSVTKKEERVGDLYFAKYPVTNSLYRQFIAWLEESPELLSAFTAELRAIAKNNVWGEGFAGYLEGGNNLTNKFRSKYDEDRKFDGDYQPVVGITWYAAQAYCLWLSWIENGRSYRLPSEVEWQWAAGGKQGTKGEEVRKYPWEDEDEKPHAELLNYNKIIGGTSVVGSYPRGATPEGLYDMAGNVWELMANTYDEGCDSNRSSRGGSWLDDRTDRFEVKYRNAGFPDCKWNDTGFRVVCVL